MADMAYFATYETPVDGKTWTIGLAERDKPGYRLMKPTGAAEDPLYLAKGPTHFDTRAEAQEEVDRLNTHYFRLDPKDALIIVVSSMQASRR